MALRWWRAWQRPAALAALCVLYAAHAAGGLSSNLGTGTRHQPLLQQQEAQPDMQPEGPPLGAHPSWHGRQDRYQYNILKVWNPCSCVGALVCVWPVGSWTTVP